MKLFEAVEPVTFSDRSTVMRKESMYRTEYRHGKHGTGVVISRKEIDGSRSLSRDVVCILFFVFLVLSRPCT